jgi:hypothetical protein
LGQGGVNHYAANPLIVALSPGHSDKTRFRPWSPAATGNGLDGTKRKNFQTLLRRSAPSTFLIRVSLVISGPTSRGPSCPNLHEWWTQPAHVRCPVAELLI